MAADSASSLARAVALGLTGESLLLAGERPVADELADEGFDGERLRELRRARQEARRPWPFPVPVETLRAVGFARYDAALAEAREALGLTGLAPATPASRSLNRDEQRLVADRPPHW
ncbi:MAG: hypothetical protein QM713_12250 [Arachnia sp.]